MRALLVTVALLGLGFGGPTSASAAGADVLVTVEPAAAALVLGDSLPLRVTVTNSAAAASVPLVVHLDVTDPTRAASVDPEDWTTTLTRSVGVLAPHGVASVDWTVQPVAPGTFAVYAVALPADSGASDRVSSSNVLRVAVQDRRVLNPGGILPVALGAPALVGVLLLAQRRRGRRRG